MDFMRISWTHDSVNILYNEDQPSNLKYDGPMINFSMDPYTFLPCLLYKRIMKNAFHIDRDLILIYGRRPGPDPGRCNRCICIGQKKIADAFIGQIFTANNKKQHFLRKHTAYNAKIPTKLLFPRNEYDTYSKFTSKRFVFPKTYPRTITLTFPPLIYIAMFQNLLFNNVNIKIFILDFVYVFESARIKCFYAIAHMSDYM